MGVCVEGAGKSLHLPRLYALQVIPAGVSVEGDFVHANKTTGSGQEGVVKTKKEGDLKVVDFSHPLYDTI